MVYELKGKEQLDKVVNDFVSQFGCTAELGTDFNYCYETERLQYSLLMSAVANETFMKFICENHPEAARITDNIFIWSLLHEIGHHETWRLWSDTEQAEFDETKELIDALSMCCEDEEEYAKYCTAYCYILDECVATAWAADYIYFHEKELREFWEKWTEELWTFCIVNDFDEGLKAFQKGDYNVS